MSDGQRTHTARRLHTQLAAIKTTWEKKEHQNKNGLAVLRVHWDDKHLPPASSEEHHQAVYMRWLSEFIAMPQEVLKDVYMLGGSIDFAAPGLEAIADGFANRLLAANFPNNPWLNDENLARLDGAASILSHNSDYSEGNLESVTVDAILAQTTSLLKTVREADLPAELKKFLLDSLLQVQYAATSYSVGGLDGLQSALDRIIGEWARSSTVQEQEEQEGEDGLGKKVLAVLAGVMLVINIANGAADLVAHEIMPWNGVDPDETIVATMPQKELGPGPDAEPKALPAGEQTVDHEPDVDCSTTQAGTGPSDTPAG